MRRFSPWYVVIAIVVIIIIWLIASYNGLITARGDVANKWADVQAQEQRRMDLVPNLVETVKGAANFEQSTFREVTDARSSWARATSVGDRAGQIQAAGTFDSAFSRLLVTVEAYPQLQATQAFRDLMTQLEGTENRIATARRDYNNAVFVYNTRVQRFPGNLTARLFGFTTEKSFEAQPGAATAPKVNFGQ